MNNKLEGAVPPEMAQLARLHVCNLKYNLLTGTASVLTVLPQYWHCTAGSGVGWHTCSPHKLRTPHSALRTPHAALCKLCPCPPPPPPRPARAPTTHHLVLMLSSMPARVRACLCAALRCG
jgi:hypothetical protein